MSRAKAESGASPVAEGAFSTRTVVWMLVIAVSGALAFGALSVFAPQIRQGQDPGAHALSHSAIGYAGLVQLLKATGRPVTVSRGYAGSTGLDLLVLTPPPNAAESEIDALAAKAGVVLIIAPKWIQAPDPRHPGWAFNLGMIPPTMVKIAKRTEVTQAVRSVGRFQPVLTPRADDNGMLSGHSFDFGPIDSFQTQGKGEAEVALMDQNGRPVLLKALSKTKRAEASAQPPKAASKGPPGQADTSSKVGAPEDATPAETSSKDKADVGDTDEDGHVYILTDPDLLNNQGIADLKTAEGATQLINLLSGQTGSVVFDATLNGFKRDRSPFQTALEPPFLAATLAVLGAAILMGWRTIASFGPVERRARSVALGKRALVDSSAGLIRLTRRTPRMAKRYAALIRSATLLDVGARELTPEAGDAYLDRLSESVGAEPFTRLVARANSTQSEAELMRSVKALSEWKSEVVRERG